jgi:hypothetical protein
MPSSTRPRFNPPPNWPAMPQGFEPDPNWKPDASLPPVPPGWPLWILGAKPKPERRHRRPATIAIGAISIILVAVLLVFFLVDKGNTPPPSAGQPGAPCALFTPVHDTTDTKAFIVTMRISSLCPGGTVLSHNTRVTLAASGQDIAAAMFDLAASPIVVPPGGSAHYVLREFRFPVGMFWRTPDILPPIDPNAATSGALDVRYDPTTQPVAAQRPPRNDARTAIDASGPAPPRSGDVEAASVTGLNAIADADHQPVDSQLKDKWVPQLSTKWRGQQWQGVTYNDPDILNDHVRLRLSFNNVRLVGSGEWTTLRDSAHPDAWITLEGSAFPDAIGANAWCDTNNLGPNDCYARLLSVADPPPQPDHVYRH